MSLTAILFSVDDIGAGASKLNTSLQRCSDIWTNLESIYLG